MIYASSAQTTINVPPGSSIYFISNQGTNTAKIDSTTMPAQKDMGPFQISSTSRISSAVYGCCALLSAYVAVVIWMEYLIYHLEHGAVSSLIRGTKESDLHIAHVCAHYAREHPADNPVLAVYASIAYERACTRTLEKMVRYYPAQCLPHYKRARTLVRQYNKPLDILFDQLTAPDLSQRMIDALTMSQDQTSQTCLQGT